MGSCQVDVLDGHAAVGQDLFGHRNRAGQHDRGIGADLGRGADARAGFQAMGAAKLGIANERVLVTLGQQGNTSAASIPLALDDGIRSGKVLRGQNLLLEGVGGGFTWGAACVRY